MHPAAISLYCLRLLCAQLPNITLNPTLSVIQDAINSTAKAILQVIIWPSVTCARSGVGTTVAA